jgi:hypothetical protein
MNYTLADVVRMSRAKRRSVQLWADAGIIRAYGITERKGTGTHRQFARDEIIIASIINVFSQRQVAIGELQRLGTAIRQFLNSGTSRSLLEDAVGNVGWISRDPVPAHRVFMVLTWRRDVDPINVDVIGLAHLGEKLGMELGEESAISALISLNHCLAGLRGT